MYKKYILDRVFFRIQKYLPKHPIQKYLKQESHLPFYYNATRNRSGITGFMVVQKEKRIKKGGAGKNSPVHNMNVFRLSLP